MHLASKKDEQAFPGWSIVLYVVIISIAVDVAFVASRMAHLSWIGTGLAIGTAGLLMGAILFTVGEMGKLERRSR